MKVWSVLGWWCDLSESLSFGYWRGAGDVYGWWGFSRASKILFRCIVCSSFKWLLLGKFNICVIFFYRVEVGTFIVIMYGLQRVLHGVEGVCLF